MERNTATNTFRLGSIFGVTASEVMSRDCPSVPGDTSLAEFVEHFLPRSGRRCYVVGESEAPRGIITLNDVLSIPRDEWGQTSVQAAMRRADQIYSVSPARLRESDARFLPISSTVLVDSPKDAIIEEAERWGADLIVVGSHGYRGPERALLGSVSQAVAMQAKCSVEIARRRRQTSEDVED